VKPFNRPLTILPIDTINSVPPQRGDPPIRAKEKGRRQIRQSGLTRWFVQKQGGSLSENDREAVAEFIRTKGIIHWQTREANQGETRR
jgi:hypothetical protein